MERILADIHERELDRVVAKLQSDELAADERGQLYAVQQALVWSRSPDSFKSPYDLIVGANIPEGLEDCPAGSGHSLSSDNLDHHDSGL